MDIESLGQIILIGTGHPPNQGPGAGLGLSGGCYGGVGGGSLPEQAYGSVFSPVHLGSGGGGTTAGSGGGHVNMKIGRTLHVNGIITAAGSDASGEGGGGSGGTILIQAFNMTGHGILDSSGGAGAGSGGGGGGGRIAVHIDYSNVFGGIYSARGGANGQGNLAGAQVGGPGTVYKYESNYGPQYRELKYNPRLNRTALQPQHSKLLVDNQDLDTDNPAIVMEEDTVYYELDETQVEGYSYIHFYHPPQAVSVNIVIHELTGNRKGLVRVQDKQRLVIHFVASTHTYLDAPCGFHVDHGGEVILPSTLIVLAEAVILEGCMTGVEELTVERGGEFIIQGEASTGHLPDDEDWYLGGPQTSHTPGFINLQILTITSRGTLTIATNPHVSRVYAADLFVKPSGMLRSQSLWASIASTNITVEKQGRISGEGGGYPAGTGPGKGNANTRDASGGGHGHTGKHMVTYIAVISVNLVLHAVL